MKKIFSILSIICLSVIAVSCNNEMEDAEQQVGYLKLDFETLLSTNTRAVTPLPSGYNARTLAVEIKDNQGKIVLVSHDAAKDDRFKSNLTLEPGTYTITAHSAGWDGSDSGLNSPYYTGFTTVTVRAKVLSQATVTLTQANVKVSVKFDSNFSTYFTNVNCYVTSSNEDVTMRRFTPSTSISSAYFPVGPLNFMLSVKNRDGVSYTMEKEITDVNARDHFIINYKIAEAGSIGGITVKFDDSTQSYTFDIEVPRQSSTSLNVGAANAFTTFAYLTGAVTAKTSEFTENNLKLQWKRSADANWTDVPASSLTKGENDSYSYKLGNLTPETEYVYRMNYNDGNTNVNSNEVTFSTEAMGTIYNAGFENWYMDGSVAICGKQGDPKYWNSSNAGASSFIGSVTTQDTGFKHGGNSSAKLATAWASIKLAAASLFTGNFVGLIGTKGAKLDWGVSFTSRPSALKGYYSYTPGSINRGTQPTGVGAPAKNSNDECQITCALVTEQFHVANADATGYELTTQIDWQNDSRIVAYGQMTKNTSSNGAWQEFNIPLVYYSLTKKPTHLIIVCSASKWGDYFYGSDKSVLYLDDFSFEYGEPTLK